MGMARPLPVARPGPSGPCYRREPRSPGRARDGSGGAASGRALAHDREVAHEPGQVRKPVGIPEFAVGARGDAPAMPAGDRGLDRLLQRPGRPWRARSGRRRRSGGRAGCRGRRGPPRARRRSPRRSSRWRRSTPASGRHPPICMVPRSPRPRCGSEGSRSSSPPLRQPTMRRSAREPSA